MYSTPRIIAFQNCKPQHARLLPVTGLIVCPQDVPANPHAVLGAWGTLNLQRRPLPISEPFWDIRSFPSPRTCRLPVQWAYQHRWGALIGLHGGWKGSEHFPVLALAGWRGSGSGRIEIAGYALIGEHILGRPAGVARVLVHDAHQRRTAGLGLQPPQLPAQLLKIACNPVWCPVF